MVEQDDTAKATPAEGRAAASRATKTTTATAEAPAASADSGPRDGGEWNRATHGQPPSERYASGDF